MSKVLVIGAQNIDIYAKTIEPYVLGDSNIASIHMAFGGVGRNIVENLTRLGNDVTFITAFGKDTFSKTAIESLQHMNVSIEHALFLDTAKSNIYIGIMDEQNDLFVGLNDMPLSDELSVSFVKAKDDIISQFDHIVLDNNLSPALIAYLLKTYRHKALYIDAVSAKKAHKISSYLSYIRVLKVNQLELEALSHKTTNEERIKDLLARGVQGILLSNQEKPCSYIDLQHHITKQPPKMEHITNASGAGDGFFSGFIHGLIVHNDIEKALEIAINVSQLTLLANNSTSDILSRDKVEKQ